MSQCTYVDYFGVRCSLAEHDILPPTAKALKEQEAQEACEREARLCAEAEK